MRDLEDAIVRANALPSLPFVRPPDVVSVPVHVLDRSRGLLVGCGATEQGLFVRGTQPDINNRICVDGRIQGATRAAGHERLRPVRRRVAPVHASLPAVDYTVRVVRVGASTNVSASANASDSPLDGDEVAALVTVQVRPSGSAVNVHAPR